ncbi:unnamed protein product [Dicrocoelium dendriticum]|nr:unnamed protein product [Dicrocoelium dendriticum]
MDFSPAPSIWITWMDSIDVHTNKCLPIDAGAHVQLASVKSTHALDWEHHGFLWFLLHPTANFVIHFGCTVCFFLLALHSHPLKSRRDATYVFIHL